MVWRTALSIYQTLVHYYGTCNFADCAELFNSLSGLYSQPGRVQEYVSKWRTGLSRLQSARFPFSVKLSISQFIRNLPVLPAFNTLWAALPAHVSAAGDQDYGFLCPLLKLPWSWIPFFILPLTMSLVLLDRNWVLYPHLSAHLILILCRNHLFP